MTLRLPWQRLPCNYHQSISFSIINTVRAAWNLNKMRHLKPIFFLLLLLLVTSCEPIPDTISSRDLLLTPTSTPEMSRTLPLTSTMAPTPTLTQTEIPPTITPTPWALESFSTSALRPGVIPVSYLDDPCAYLAGRWGEGKSEPGTIVVPIMFHSILPPGREARNPEDITMAYFEYFMGFAEELGFQTVTVPELVEFLLTNKEIPKHSMLLILDDRRPDTPNLFMPYLEENDWTLTLAWPTTEETNDQLWAKVEAYTETGRIEVQAHGHQHDAGTYINEFTPWEIVEQEIIRPIEVIREHFGTDPQAFVWPGGMFTVGSVQLARETGYDLGFTVYSRGPVMYNWIPLGENERAMADPLMVLPRYWSSAADVALLNALSISEEAEQQAEAVKEQERLYYSLFCQPAGSGLDAEN